MAARSATTAAGKTRVEPDASADVRGEPRALRTQGRRTQAKLLDAGMTVLRERGYHAARVDDVVRVADVSHGTFYLYFANKEDLFGALAMRCAEEMTDLIGSLGPVAPGDEGRRELEQWVGRFVACYREYGVVIRAWMEDQISSKELRRLGARTFSSVNTALVDRLRESADGGTAIEPADAELAAAALLAMIERFTYFMTSRDLAFDDDLVVHTLATLIHRGFFGG